MDNPAPPPSLRERLTAELRRVRRRESAIKRDLARIDQIVADSARGPWLLQLAAQAKRGARTLEGTDWSTGEAVSFQFPLDPKRSAREQVERLFAEAKRVVRGRSIAEERLRAAESDLILLQELEAALLAPEVDLETLEARFTEHFARVIQKREARVVRRERKLPYRAFVCSGDVLALVGRDAKRNDETTTQHAKPWHLWLHARGVTGAHVIGALARNTEATSELLVDCAHLAAHFSSAKDEPIVDVSYTERRFVRKPRKSPVGSVVLDREKVLPLRVDADRLRRLLATETFPEGAS